MIRAFLIERTSATLLEANWAFKGALVPHHGKAVALTLGDDAPLCFEILPHYFRIIPLVENPELRIIVPAGTSIALCIRQLRQQSLMGAGLIIEGDMNLAEALQQAFTLEDTDFGAFWSPWLAPIAGPLMNQGLAFLRKQAPEWGDHLRTYLQEEKALLPTTTRFEDFRAGVVACRQAVERLEARLEDLC